MTINNFRIAASVLIVFNLVGTVVTWTANLVAPGTSKTDAILNGTEFTGPLLFIALWIVFVLMTLIRGVAAKIGVALMTIFALIFTVGETSELFKANVGVGTDQWTFVLAASVVGLVLGATTAVLGIGYLVKSRKP
jgi:hypothetical protein